MIERIRAFCEKKRELIIFYLIGGGTTAAAWGCKYLCNLLLFGGTAFPTAAQNTVLSMVENVAAIAYAYPTNRRWVFRSRDPHILKEFGLFTLSRLAAWSMGWILNMLLVGVLKVSIYVSTVIVGVVGVNINYTFSRLFVFRKEDGASANAEEPDARSCEKIR